MYLGLAPFTVQGILPAAHKAATTVSPAFCFFPSAPLKAPEPGHSPHLWTLQGTQPGSALCPHFLSEEEKTKSCLSGAF